MAPTHKKRLLLLCGTSLLALQLAALPIGLDHHGVGLRQAQAQESCFTAGTTILMADGSQRAIEVLRVGDRVVGRRGRINRVLQRERTSLGARRLYAINGGRPFVTAEHPFLTAEGWKALDPEATRRENARLRVGSLQLGDRLCRGALRVPGGERRMTEATPAGLFVQHTTTLELLSAIAADPSTQLYNLLLDGDHSYVADGWIVHNKEGDGDGGGGDGGGGDGGGGDGGGGDGGGGDSGGGDGGGADGGGGGGGGGDGGGGDGGGGDSGGGDGGGGDGGGGDGGGGDGGGGDSGGGDGGGGDGGGGDGGGGDGGGGDGGGGDGGGGDSGGGEGGGGDGGGGDGGGGDSGGGEGGGSDSGGGDSGGGDGGGTGARSGGTGPSASGAAAAGGAAAGGAAHRGATQAGATPRGAAAAAPARAAPTAAEARPPAQGTISGFLDGLGIERPRDAGVQPKGAALTRDQERTLIRDRWRKRD